MPNTLVWILAIACVASSTAGAPFKAEADAALNAQEHLLPSPKSLTLNQDVASLTKQAEQGDLRALGIRSLLYQTAGNGTTDMEAALKAARKSSHSGNAFGQYALARLYLQSGKPKDRKQAIALIRTSFTILKQAAGAGDVWAQLFAALILDRGIGVKQDHLKAIEWYQAFARDRFEAPDIDPKIRSERLENITKNKMPVFRVLVLGDSMSLCGFGEHLDGRLRMDKRINAVFTYMACGTTPASWVTNSSLRQNTTSCGFCSIESVPGRTQPQIYKDTYDPPNEPAPTAHPVPSLEQLLQTLRPDILVVQTGTNLMSFFPDGATVRPDREGPMIERHITPFIATAVRSPAPLLRIYWIGSPVSGRVSQSVHDFITDRLRSILGPFATLIDSRQLLSYPYRKMSSDKQHFFGAEMDQWANKVYDIISTDLLAATLSPVPPLPLSALAKELPESPQNLPAVQPITLSLRLIQKSNPLPPSALLPYRDSLVAYLYEVEQVLSGVYPHERILVMHPAHINLKEQLLEDYQIGRRYTLTVREVKGTPWETIKSSDESGALDLEPYISLDDVAKLPPR
jgi:hypothetical protein